MVNFFIRNGINRRIVPSLDSPQSSQPKSVNNKPPPSQRVFTVHANNTQSTISENVFIRSNNTKPIESIDDKIHFNSHIKQCEKETHVKSEDEKETHVKSEDEEETHVKSEDEEEPDVKSEDEEETHVKSEDEEEPDVKSEDDEETEEESQ